MAFSGLVKANNLSDIADKEKAWDNLGLVISTVDYQSGDADIDNYINGVQEADGASLEPEIKNAIFAFITGCKADGIWTAIKASCILAGARTLAGALVPLVGAAPTNFNFVSVDYNRKTGLVGNGSTKYLNSNRNNNADPQDSQHLAVHATTVSTLSPRFYTGFGNTETSATSFGVDATGLFFRSRSSTFVRPNPLAGSHAPGLIGMSRSTSAQFVIRANQSNTNGTATSVSPASGDLLVFRSSALAFIEGPVNARLAFYSIGESLDLALLDARVTALINDFAAALS